MLIPAPPEYLSLMQQTRWFPPPELVGPALMVAGILLIVWKLIRLTRATPLHARPRLKREGWSPMMLEKTQHVILDDPKPDRKATRNGSEMIGYFDRISFMRATGCPEVRCMFCPGYADDVEHVGGCPQLTKPYTAVEAREGLRKAFSDPELIKRRSKVTERESRAARQLPRQRRDSSC
jgi:hypothetical protein